MCLNPEWNETSLDKSFQYCKPFELLRNIHVGNTDPRRSYFVSMYLFFNVGNEVILRIKVS